MSDDRHARISEHAYRLWQQEGEPHGRDQAHWDEAERAFAGEGPVADEPDPQADSATEEAPAESSSQAAPSGQAPAAPAPAAKPVAAKKPAARRKRTS